MDSDLTDIKLRLTRGNTAHSVQYHKHFSNVQHSKQNITHSMLASKAL